MDDVPGKVVLEGDDLLCPQGKADRKNSDSEANKDRHAELHQGIWPDPACQWKTLTP